MSDTSPKPKPALNTPEQTDCHDRLLTANALHYRRITHILVRELPVVSKKAGRLDDDEIHKTKAILDNSSDIRTVCNHIVKMREDCVEVTASLLEVEFDAAQRLLDDYWGSMPDGRMTNSFGHWLRETARFPRED